MNIINIISTELNLREKGVEAAVKLMDEGCTIPFISRYRKEVTGNLTDVELRNIEERLAYLRKLDERINTVLKSIEEQGKLTDELKEEVWNNPQEYIGRVIEIHCQDESTNQNGEESLRQPRFKRFREKGKTPSYE